MKNKLIFSVCQQNNQDDANIEWTKDLLTINKIEYKAIVGAYNNINELSFVVSDNKRTRQLVSMICDFTNQDCYLRVDIFSKSYLHFFNGDVQYIGYFRKVTRQHAKLKDAYFIIDNEYFVAE